MAKAGVICEHGRGLLLLEVHDQGHCFGGCGVPAFILGMAAKIVQASAKLETLTLGVHDVRHTIKMQLLCEQHSRSLVRQLDDTIHSCLTSLELLVKSGEAGRGRTAGVGLMSE